MFWQRGGTTLLLPSRSDAFRDMFRPEPRLPDAFPYPSAVAGDDFSAAAAGKVYPLLAIPFTHQVTMSPEE